MALIILGENLPLSSDLVMKARLVDAVFVEALAWSLHLSISSHVVERVRVRGSCSSYGSVGKVLGTAVEARQLW